MPFFYQQQLLDFTAPPSFTATPAKYYLWLLFKSFGVIVTTKTIQTVSVLLLPHKKSVLIITENFAWLCADLCAG